ncbi:hypothetical protein [Virgibacillus litoralis]|uniref:Uncharacterized protein n=1 Tax=Virgibacillus litoralis TaxID=578221 RepID=A0ABS4HI50_9BACI|nr:hypothetical protein [Virgibacillus litoralis]MBP1950279.1 hypothetical protein [Virgibacillus litoralis]
MITNTFKTLLFISSFLPLYFILMVKFYDFDKPFKCNLVENTIPYSVLTLLIVISIVTFLYFLFCELNEEEEFEDIENIDSEILSYFITYIVPLTTLKVDQINGVLVNILLFIVIGVFYVKSNIFYLNILFTFSNFNVYTDKDKKIIISKKKAQKINELGLVKVRKVGDKIYIINKK